jgi:ferredoxin
MSRVLLSNGKTFEVPPDVTLLEAAQHAGLALPHSCRSGRCGSCKAKGSAKRATSARRGLLERRRATAGLVADLHRHDRR